MPLNSFEVSTVVSRHLDPGAPLRILELGAGVLKRTHRAPLERKNWVYAAADLEEGPDVDHVLSDPYRWSSFGDRSFDCVLVLGFLERLPFFWLTFKEVVRVLRPGGLILLTASEENGANCWTFRSDGLRALAALGDLEILSVESGEDGIGEAAAFRKPAAPADAAAPAPTGAPPISSSLVRDPAYARRYGITVAEWMIHHHEQITFERVSWAGVGILKNPLDCWIYQEILWEVQPEIIVEIGSLAGGSTLFFCHMLDLLGRGTLVSVERDRTHFNVKHPRLVEVTGDCADPAVRARVAGLCAGKTTLIVHDADHTREAVLRDLRAYGDLVTPGSYFIVEDGVVDLFEPGATSRLGWQRPGPLAAVRQFTKEDDRFVIDSSRERYLITYNPCGFLRRAR